MQQFPFLRNWKISIFCLKAGVCNFWDTNMRPKGSNSRSTPLPTGPPSHLHSATLPVLKWLEAMNYQTKVKKNKKKTFSQVAVQRQRHPLSKKCIGSHLTSRPTIRVTSFYWFSTGLQYIVTSLVSTLLWLSCSRKMQQSLSSVLE